MSEAATITPQIPGDPTTPRAVADRARRNVALRRRGRAVGRLQRAALLRRGRRAKARKRAARSRRDGNGLGFTPTALVIAALLVAARATARLTTGATSEEIGLGLRNLLVGERYEDTVARMDVLGTAAGSPDVLFEVGANQKITADVRRWSEALNYSAKHKARGQRAIEEEFPVESMFDLIVDKVAEVLVDAATGPGGQSFMETMRQVGQQRQQGFRAR